MKNRTYRYFEGDVLYPFGFGLSYSRFSYHATEVSSAQVQAGSSVTVSAEVRNSGEREGDEVARTLRSCLRKRAVSPHLELEGFKRIHLRAGETQQVQFTLSPRQLSEVDEKGERAVVSGDYAIFIAGGQPGKETPAATIHVSGTAALPR